MPTPPVASAPSVEAYIPSTAIAARVARHLDERPPTVAGIIGVADALNVPVECFLIGGPR